MDNRPHTQAECLRATADARIAALIQASRAVVIENIAEGTRRTVKRLRRAWPLDRLELPDGCYNAALLYRQAWEHVGAGRGLGPMPWGKDVTTRGMSQPMPAQLRALSAAEWLRRGAQIMGLAATQGVVHWVVIAGLPLIEYDATRKWAKGRGQSELVAALVRLAKEYRT